MLCISGRARGAELRRATRQLQLQWGRLRHLAYNPELQVCPKVSVTIFVEHTSQACAPAAAPPSSSNEF